MLKAGEHYIELKKDFSNIQSVLEIISDNEKLEEIANRALAHITSNYSLTYDSLISRLDQLIDENTPLIRNSRLYVPKLLMTSVQNKSGLSIRRFSFIRSGFKMPSNTISEDDLSSWEKRSTYLYEVLYPLEALRVKLLSSTPGVFVKIFRRVNLYRIKVASSFKAGVLYSFFSRLFGFLMRLFKNVIGRI